MEKTKQNWIEKLISRGRIFKSSENSGIAPLNRFHLARAMLNRQIMFIGILLLLIGMVSAGDITMKAGDLDVDGNLNVTKGLNLSMYPGCSALETDASGNVLCGTDDDSGMDYTNLMMANKTNIPATNDTYDLGSSTSYFNEVYVNILNLITKITGSQIADDTITFSQIGADAIKDSEIDYSEVTLNDFTNDAGFINGMDYTNIVMTNKSNTFGAHNQDFDSGTLFIDSSTHRVGVKEIGPAANLHIVHGGAGEYGAVLLLEQDVIGNSDGPKIQFRKNITTFKDWTIGVDDGVGVDDFVISEDGGIGGWGTPRLTVQAGGQVGIGTTTPTSKLEVAGGDINISTGGSWLRMIGSDSGVDLGYGTTVKRVAADGRLQLNSQNNIIELNGKVGIGTTSPSHSLTTGGAGTSEAVKVFRNSDTSDYTLYGRDATGGYIYQGADSKPFLIYTNNAERLRVLSDGKVGIGIAAPAYPLSVKGAINSHGAGGESGLGYIVLGDPADASKYIGMWRGAANSLSAGNDLNLQGYSGMHFMVSANAFGSATERMTILSDGKVGIGTTTPAEKLEVNGNINFENFADKLMWVQGPSGQYITEAWGIEIHGDVTHPVQVPDAALLVGYDQTDGTGRTVGNALISGDVGIGTATPSYKLDVNEGADGYAMRVFNDGGTSNRWGIINQIGTDDNSGTNIHVAWADGDGNTLGYVTSSGGTVTYGAFTGSHVVKIPEADNIADTEQYAEPKYGNYKYGTVMCVKSTSQNPETPHQVDYEVEPCKKAKDKSVLGVYSSKYEDEENLHSIYALGDGHILVTKDGGDIEVGDYLTSSDTEGYAMKQAPFTVNEQEIGLLTDYTVAKATEAVTWADEKSDTKLISCTYHSA